jgi:hypothetical protein
MVCAAGGFLYVGAGTARDGLARRQHDQEEPDGWGSKGGGEELRDGREDFVYKV